MTSLSHSSCPACANQSTITVARIGSQFDVLKCTQCSLEFINPLVSGVTTESSSDTAPEYIERMKEEYPLVRSIVKERATERLRLYTRLLDGKQPTKLLEIGSGPGWMIRAYKDLGLDALGIEIDNGLVSIAQSLGVNTIHVDICKWNCADSPSYDVVCASQVLEHILTPQTAIQNMAQFLRPGGLLHIDVPNANSWGSQVRRCFRSQRNWGAIALPQHQIGYFPVSIKRLFDNAGLKLIGVFEKPTNDKVYGQIILPRSKTSRLFIYLTYLLGHGYLLIGLAQKL